MSFKRFQPSNRPKAPVFDAPNRMDGRRVFFFCLVCYQCLLEFQELHRQFEESIRLEGPPFGPSSAECTVVSRLVGKSKPKPQGDPLKGNPLRGTTRAF